MSSFGDLPIHLALRMESVVKERHMKDILLLLNYSTEINIPDKKGNTPIILAASFCSVDVIKKMIEIGADMTYKEDEGNSALHKHMGILIRMLHNIIIIYACMAAALNTQNNLGETPFNRFMKSSYIVYKDIQFLVEDCGSDLNNDKIGCNSALMDAIERNRFYAVPYLIRHMVNLNHIGQEGQTALHVALLKGKCRFDLSIEAKLKRIRTDIQEMSDVKDTSVNIRKRGCSFQEEVPLKRRRYLINQVLERQSGKAVKTASEISKTKIDDNRQAKVVETVMCLLNAGADVNIITENGKSPLYLLLSKHPWKIVQKLFPLIIEKGADPNLGHYPPLEIATLLRRVSHVKSLLKHGAKVDITNRRNETALICATRMCYLEKKEKLIQTIEILLQAGASVNVKDEQGNTPLIISIRNGCFQERDNLDSEVNKIVSLLLKNGADPNTQDNGKDSALILAVENMLPSVVRTLLKYGANVDHIGEHCGSILQRCLHTKSMRFKIFLIISIKCLNFYFCKYVYNI
ncbi:unnamed protein product [Mytilus edulis]|uniref:Uncharacterized protein n=1 Tax=Mytilus edulis TaxID=6550 RepID=A0A8S3SM25_MYTED|nr:unnamed protein product [Mytilus edulis]